MDGDVSESNFTRLNDYWNIEEQAMTALAQWEMRHITLNTTLNTLSGEEKRKRFTTLSAGLNRFYRNKIIKNPLKSDRRLRRLARKNKYND